MSATTETLPELVGTEKQVAWATDLRPAIIARVERIRDQMLAQSAEHGARQGTPEQLEAGTRAIAAYARLVSRQTKATFWIDCRGMDDRRWIVDFSDYTRKQLQKAGLL